MPDYNPKRTRNLYEPDSSKPFKLSRTKIENFINCPRCFYIDRRLGIRPPDGPPFNLNLAVDELLKREFDQYREAKKPHPLFEEADIDAIPFEHPDLNTWRTNFTGVQFLHENTNLLVHGAVDDVWQQPDGTLIVADYKATSKNSQVNIDADWQISYKRQMEFYQWLLRQNGFEVSDTCYFVYCNGIRDREAFDKRLEFDISMIPYTGDDSWVDGVIHEAHECLNSDELPPVKINCRQCQYNIVINNIN